MRPSLRSNLKKYQNLLKSWDFYARNGQKLALKATWMKKKHYIWQGICGLQSLFSLLTAARRELFPFICALRNIFSCSFGPWVDLSLRPLLYALLRNKHLKPTGEKDDQYFFNELTLGVNFIKVLRAAFAPVDPKSVKRYWRLDWILTLLRATGVKAANKYVGEIEPRCWFHQHFKSSFYIAKGFAQLFCFMSLFFVFF